MKYALTLPRTRDDTATCLRHAYATHRAAASLRLCTSRDSAQPRHRALCGAYTLTYAVLPLALLHARRARAIIAVFYRAPHAEMPYARVLRLASPRCAKLCRASRRAQVPAGCSLRTIGDLRPSRASACCAQQHRAAARLYLSNGLTRLTARPGGEHSIMASAHAALRSPFCAYIIAVNCCVRGRCAEGCCSEPHRGCAVRQHARGDIFAVRYGGVRACTPHSRLMRRERCWLRAWKCLRAFAGCIATAPPLARVPRQGYQEQGQGRRSSRHGNADMTSGRCETGYHRGCHILGGCAVWRLLGAYMASLPHTEIFYLPHGMPARTGVRRAL